jgi:hypothetical protein
MSDIWRWYWLYFRRSNWEGSYSSCFKECLRVWSDPNTLLEREEGLSKGIRDLASMRLSSRDIARVSGSRCLLWFIEC